MEPLLKQKLKNKLHELIDSIEEEQALLRLDEIIAGAGREQAITYEEFSKNIDDWLTRLEPSNSGS